MPDFGASEIALITSALGGSAMQNLGSGGQELQSFEGEGDISPVSMLRQGKGVLQDWMTATMDRAGQPVNLQTTVQPLPSFSGGGLPFSIGAPGLDPNRDTGGARVIPRLGDIVRHNVQSGGGATIGRRTLNSAGGSAPTNPISRESMIRAGTDESTIMRDTTGAIMPESQQGKGGVIRPDDGSAQALSALRLMGFA